MSAIPSGGPGENPGAELQLLSRQTQRINHQVPRIFSPSARQIARTVVMFGSSTQTFVKIRDTQPSTGRWCGTVGYGAHAVSRSHRPSMRSGVCSTSRPRSGWRKGRRSYSRTSETLT